jgi:hypothetical protein
MNLSALWYKGRGGTSAYCKKIKAEAKPRRTVQYKKYNIKPFTNILLKLNQNEKNYDDGGRYGCYDGM